MIISEEVSEKKKGTVQINMNLELNNIKKQAAWLGLPWRHIPEAPQEKWFHSYICISCTERDEYVQS